MRRTHQSSLRRTPDIDDYADTVAVKDFDEPVDRMVAVADGVEA